MSACGLCLKEAPLAKSHIFPEFFFKSSYDKAHKFNEFRRGKNEYNKRQSKGYRERLLCPECESLLNENYEDYSKTVLYDQIIPHFETNKSPFKLAEYKYDNFKLFSLSLIWRASISKHEFFEAVSLGPKYEEELRKYLLKGSVPAKGRFPIAIGRAHLNGLVAEATSIPPFRRRLKENQKTVYSFIIDGFQFFIGIGNAVLPLESVTPEILQIGMSNLMELDEFRNLFDELKREGKFSIYENSSSTPLTT